MAKLKQRIYTYRNRRWYTHVANLTDKPMYVAWIGRMGRLLPALTASVVPLFIMVRPYKGTRKRKWQAEQIEKMVYHPTYNPNGVLAMGDLKDVEDAMKAKLPS